MEGAEMADGGPDAAQQYQESWATIVGYLKGVKRIPLQDAEDIAQQAWMRFFAEDRSYVENPGAWAMWTAKFLAINHYNRCSSVEVPLEPDGLENPSWAPRVETEPQLLARFDLATIIGSLSGREREVVEQRYLEQLPVNEIARRLGLKQCSVSVYLSSAIDRVNAKFGRKRKRIRRKYDEIAAEAIREAGEPLRLPVLLDAITSRIGRRLEAKTLHAYLVRRAKSESPSVVRVGRGLWGLPPET